MNPRRLYRSRDRQLAGVAGGMAEYLDIDPTVIRIAWILVTIFSGGLALLGYLLLALIIPNSPYVAGMPPSGGPMWGAQPAPGWTPQPGVGWGAQPAPSAAWQSGGAAGAGGWNVPPTSAQWQAPASPAYAVPVRHTRGLGAAGIVGILLVVIGAIALLDVVLPGVRFGVVLGPAVILALGAALLVSSIRRPVGAPVATPATSSASAASTAASTAGAGTEPAWSDVPADMTPWPTTTAPTAPAAPQAPAPEAAAPMAQPAYVSDETKVDPV